MADDNGLNVQGGIETIEVTAPRISPQEEIVASSVVPESQGQREKFFNISKFRSNMDRDEILPKHSFLVVFSQFQQNSKANNVLKNYIKKGESLTLRCDGAMLPNKDLLKTDIRRFGYGPIERVPYDAQFGDISLSWIVDKKGEQVKFFYDWMNLIVNTRSYGGGNMLTSNKLNGFNPYEVGYKDDYANRQTNIFVYDRQQKPVLVYEIYDLFPTAINAIDVNWGTTDDPMRVNIQFSYTDYTLRTPKLEETNISFTNLFSNLEETIFGKLSGKVDSLPRTPNYY